jgi:tripartite-type tricarboxylate transporter receptor subunit TctC
MRKLCAILMSAVLSCAAATASAQPFPSAPVRIVVPFPPGGIADTLARSVADRLAGRIGQTVLVDNRPGGNTVIAAHHVAKSKADGHTLLMGTDATLSVLPFLYSKLPFDPQQDFRPVIPVAQATSFLAISGEVPARTVDELIKLAKAKSGQLSYGSMGHGSNGHISGELFKRSTGVDIIHVPYKGLADVVAALVGAQTSMVFGNVAPMIPHIHSGRIKLLAVMGDRRSPLYPDVPTLAEAGLSGQEAMAWFGLVAPTQTPDAVVERLASEVRTIVEDSDFRQRYIASVGLEPAPAATPAAFAAFLVRDRQKYEVQLKQTGIRLD